MKRIISFVLSIVMVFSMIPTGAFATAVENDAVAETTAVTEAPVEQEETPETQAPTEEVPADTAALPEETAEETAAPTVEETEAPTEAEETTAPSEETVTEPAVTEEAVAETVAEETEAEEIYEEISETIVTAQDLPESGELYDAYLERLFYGNYAAYLGEAAREQLTELEQEFYDVLKPEILRIAAGEQVSTVVTISNAQMAAWDTDVTLVYNTTSGQTAHDNFVTQFNLTRILNALMHDCPYEMYWYDKTVGTIFTSGSSVFGSQTTISNVYFKFRVVGDMQPSGYDASNPTIDPTGAAAAAAAAQTAQTIVRTYSASGDYDKLVAYKKQICNLVEYNDEAAKNTTYTIDADPWQLIYVFDGDPDTSVVCEGYSKAFQYLCDLSTFQGDVSCYTVVGKLNGGGHMWNIVTMEGKNYLADVTNSDSGTAGAGGGMFLAGAEGSVSKGYTFLGYAFTYSDDTISLWGEDVLTLASTDYVPGDEALGDAVTDGCTETYIQELIDSGESWVTVSEDVVLQNNFEIPASVSVDVEGTITVPSGKTLTVNARTNISGTIRVEEGGKIIFGNAIWCFNGGTLDVAGSYEMSQNQYGNRGTIIFNYTDSADAPVINGIAADDIRLQFLIYSGEDFSNALSMMKDAVYGYYTLSVRGSVTLPGDLTIPSNCMLHLESNELTMTIPEGYTLVNNGQIYVWDQQTLANNGTIENNGGVFIYGTVINNGTFNQNASGRLEINGTWEGADPIRPSMTQDELEAAMEQAIADGYGGYTLNAPVTLERDLTVGNLWIGDGGYLTVPEGVKVTIQNALTVNPGGTLDMQGSYELLTNEGGWKGAVEIQYWYGLSGTVIGVPDADIRLHYYVRSADDMTEAIEVMEATPYALTLIYIYTDVTLDGDMTVAANTLVHLYNGATMTIDGATLVNNGEIYIWQGQTLDNDGTIENNGFVGVMGTLTNNDQIKVSADGYMVVDSTGTLNNDGTVTAPSSANVDMLGTLNGNAIVYKQDEFLAGLEEEGGYWTTETLILTSDMTIPAGKRAEFGYEGDTGALIVSDGVTLTVEGHLTFSGGATLTVESGGKLVVAGNGSITMIGGALTIADGGSYTIGENASIYASTPTVLTGISKSEVVNSGLLMDSSYDLAECLKEGEGYKEYLFDVYSDYTISEDLTLDSNIVLGNVGCTITITNGATVILNGDWNVGLDLSAEGFGMTPGHIVVENGALVINGKLALIGGSALTVNSENGTVTNNGTIQGNVTYTGMTQAELEAAIAAADGQYTLTETANVTSDMTVSHFLCVEEGGKLIIREGAELNITGVVQANGGTITIRSGGTAAATAENSGIGVINNGTLNIRGGGTLDVRGGELGVVDGTVNAETGASILGTSLFVHPLKSTVNGIETSKLSVNTGAQTQDELEALLAVAANYASALIHISGTDDSMEITKELTIPAGVQVEVNCQDCSVTAGGKLTVYGKLHIMTNIYLDSGSELTVGSDGIVTVKNLLQAAGGTITIENGGCVIMAEESQGLGVFNGGLLKICSGGTLDVTYGTVGAQSTVIAEEGAAVLGNGIELNYYGGSVTGIPASQMKLFGLVQSSEQLDEVLRVAPDYHSVQIMVVYDAEITGEKTVPANTTLNIACAGCAIAADAKVTVKGKLAVQFGNTLTNNGIIHVVSGGSLHVMEEATLMNNGEVFLSAAEDLTNDGTWSNNAYIIGEPAPETMPFEEFKAAIEMGFVDLSLKVVLEEDLTIANALYISEGGEIVVPEGVTLTLASYTQVYGGKLTVEEGGALVNNGSLYVEDNAVVEVYGTYSAGQYNRLVAEDGASSVIGVDESMITLQCYVTTEEELRAAAAKAGYKKLWISMRQSIRLTADLELSNIVDLQLSNQSVLTVSSGVALTVHANIHVFESGVVVENGGTLLVTNTGYLQIQSGYLNAEGTVEAAVQRIHINLSGGAAVTGVDTGLIGATYTVYTYEDLVSAVTESARYAFMEIEPQASVVLENDLDIPANAMLAMYDDGELMTLTIPEDVTLTNYGSIVINTNCQVWVQEGGTLDNRGGINSYHENGLVVDGTLLENTSGGGSGGSTSGVTTLDELLEAIRQGSEWIQIYGSITLTDDLTIPSGCYVNIFEGGELIVPNGVTLTIDGSISLYDGKLTVQSGAAVVLCGGIHEKGTVTVDPNASFTFVEDGYMTMDYGSTVTGIDKAQYNLIFYASTEEDIRNGLKLEDYAWVTVKLEESVTLTSNLTIADNRTLMVGPYWIPDNTSTITLTVPSGITMTSNGILSIIENIGCLKIEKGGKLVNNDNVYVHGTMNNSGTLVNNGNFYVNGTLTNSNALVNDGKLYVYGTLINNGTISGDGYMDYARPAYTYEELVGWLNADLVPTYIYIWTSLTLEGDITVPQGTQLIVEEGNLIVPSGCTVTINGEMYSQYGGVATFEEGSRLVNNNWIEAYKGTINIYGEYVEDHEDVILMLYPDSAINGVDNKYVYYMGSFTDEESLVALLEKIEQEGYGEASAYVKYRTGVVEITGNVTVPENAYLQMGYYYGDSMVLKPGAVLTNYGGVYVYAPGTLTIEDGAEFVNHGYVDAEEGCIIYYGGSIDISADKTEIYGKEKLTLSAAIAPEAMSGAKVTWSLAEGSEAYASIKASGSKVTVTAADVTEEQTIEVIASATLSNGKEVEDSFTITIHPLVKQITIEANGEDVTGQTIKYDLNYQGQRTLDLTALVVPGTADQKVDWITSSAAIADVDANGQVTFTGKDGKVTITAAATDGSNISAKVTIQAVKLVQNITLLSGDTELVGGKGTTLKVQDTTNPGKDLATSAVSWALADEDDAAYATVTAAGKVTTKVVQQAVTVVLLGTINDNPYADPIKVELDIYPAVAAVDIQKDGESVSGKTLLLDYDDTLTLAAVQFPGTVMGEAKWEVVDKKDAVKDPVIDPKTNILTLTPTGKAGTVTIKATATDGSKKTASVTVNVAKFVTGITVETDKADWNGKLTGGESMNLTASVEPAGVTNAAVTWSFADSNDKNYVTLSISGKVTAKRGLAMSKDITILATAKDGSGEVGKFTFTLLPSDPGVLTLIRDNENVTGMTLPLDLNGDGKITLTAAYFEAVEGYKVTWTVKNATILEKTDTTVTIKAAKAGKVTITAAEGKKTATVNLTAAYLSSGVNVTSKTGFDVASGKTLQLTATVQGKTNVTNKNVTWWIDEADTAYAKIASNGKLTAAKNLAEEKTITVWAQAKDGNSEAVSQTVTIKPLVSGIQIIDAATETELTNTTQVWDIAKDGRTLNLTADVFPADAAQSVTWKSSSAKIAKIDPESGEIEVIKAGTVTITATATDGSGKKATFKLTVVKSVERIDQAKTEAVLASNKSLNLAKLITVDKDATNKKVTWSMTGDTAFATLSASGTLKAKKVTDMKTVYVTATAADDSGVMAEFTVYIYPATTKVQILCDGKIDVKQKDMAVGESLTLKGVSTPSAAAQGANAYDWKTSSEKYVTIVDNGDGTLTVIGKAAGTATITCTAADGSGKKATIKIKVG